MLSAAGTPGPLEVNHNHGLVLERPPGEDGGDRRYLLSRDDRDDPAGGRAPDPGRGARGRRTGLRRHAPGECVVDLIPRNIISFYRFSLFFGRNAIWNTIIYGNAPSSVVKQRHVPDDPVKARIQSSGP